MLHPNLNKPEKKSHKNKFPPGQKSTKMWVQAVSGQFILYIQTTTTTTTLLCAQQAFHRTFTQFTSASHLSKLNSLLSFQIKGDLRFVQLPKQRYKYTSLKCRFCRGEAAGLVFFIAFPKTTCDHVTWVDGSDYREGDERWPTSYSWYSDISWEWGLISAGIQD